MIIRRELLSAIKADAKKSPVIAILGPRQSGKTTLARQAFSKHVYLSLEDLDVRQFAESDPRGFLAKYNNEIGVILDEVQHVPDILSYIQTQVDLNRRPGYFIITGSQNFLMDQAVSQTLAGRISLHTLLPFSIAELVQEDLLEKSPEQMILQGFYPLIYSEKEDPVHWYADYIKTYVQRDVRTLTNITDLRLFTTFLKLCAGRIGQIVNLTSLSNDCGVSYNTIKAWLSVLEASYVVFLLEPHYKNFSKRIVQTPKIYFYDTGLACSLLGLETRQQVSSHYLRGGLFECMIIADLFKNIYNQDSVPHLYFWRDKTGHEVDCIIERGGLLFPLEIKAGMTINSDFFDPLNFWNELAKANPEKGFLVYAGDEDQSRTKGNVVSWRRTSSIFKKIDKIANE